MGLSDKANATDVLLMAGAGDRAGAARLIPIVYQELRRLAVRFLKDERASHTLQPTALVHEAYLKLVDQTRVDWKGRTHFIAVAAEAMRRILVDHARAKNALKRGGGRDRVMLSPEVAATGGVNVDILALDEALVRLQALNERHARIVELRFFGGMTVDEAALAMGLGTTTVEEGWAVARAWLLRELSREGRA